jgi:hypothetical protein
MRLIIAIGVAAALMMPAAATSAGAAAGLHGDRASDVSGAKKRKAAKRKPAAKEQYLRAVPSAPPPGTKQ